MSIEQEILAILTQARDEIQANMSAKDINASGRSSRAFHIASDGKGFRLVYGSNERIAPLDTLELGRPAGNVPGGFRTTKKGVRDVSNLFKYILVKWGEDKGIAGWGWAQATMLGRRIADEGTLRNRNNEDVWSTPVNAAKERLRKSIRIAVLARMKTITTNF